MRAVLGLALLGLLLAPACGPDRTLDLPPLLPDPTPETDGLVLEWLTYRETPTGALVVRFHTRVELEVGGRFRYTRRRAAKAPDVWHEITGTWETIKGRRLWQLLPDAGRDALEPGQFKDWEFPALRWSAGRVPGPDAPSMGALYMVPFLDPETRRFTDTFVPRQDPRHEAWFAERVKDP